MWLSHRLGRWYPRRPEKLMWLSHWCPQRNSNPRRRLERAVSWSTRRWGRRAAEAASIVFERWRAVQQLREEGQLLQAKRLGPAHHHVHVLHRLTGGALDQVVDGADDDETAGALVDGGVDEAGVAAQGLFRLRRR